jgi:hypothetical protein
MSSGRSTGVPPALDSIVTGIYREGRQTSEDVE